MEIVLLGTGSADGWPNPFCTCASCNAAHASGDIRGQSGALLDGQLLIDCGPEIPRAAVRHGHRLDRVHTLLFTHAHPDHLGPAALLFRHWAHRTEPLHIVGPPAVIAECEPWIGPSDPVSLSAVGLGDQLRIADYTVRVLAATHEGPAIGPAVLYDITAADRTRLLYAADTGPLSGETLAQLAGADFDFALIEETFGDHLTHHTDHLDLRTFPLTLAELRRNQAVTDATQVVAIHLSHHNPPIHALSSRLAAWGVLVLPDGTILRSSDPLTPPARPHRTLILGGARSGKSALAESLVLDRPVVTYVATADERPGDAEWEERLARHRSRRPDHWSTIETKDLVGVLRGATEDDVLLIDCLTLWLTRMMDEANAWNGELDLVDKHIAELADAWVATSAQVVAVSNEVGWGVVPETASGRLFRDVHGRLNSIIAAISDEVTLVVAGRAVPMVQR